MHLIAHCLQRAYYCWPVCQSLETKYQRQLRALSLSPWPSFPHTYFASNFPKMALNIQLTDVYILFKALTRLERALLLHRSQVCHTLAYCSGPAFLDRELPEGRDLCLFIPVCPGPAMCLGTKAAPNNYRERGT